jgi:hypothetical protein
MSDDDRIAQSVREHGWHALTVEGTDVEPSFVYSIGLAHIEGCDVAIRPVHPTQHILRLGSAMAFYRRLARPEALTVRQVFWPDKAGRFPFEIECDPRASQMQPRMELAVPPSELKAFLDEYGS